jgi:hypothetical protein
LVYLLVFHACINEMYCSRSKIPRKKCIFHIYIYIYDIKFLALQGAPYIYIYDISRLRVKTGMTKLIVVLRNVANAPKIATQNKRYMKQIQLQPVYVELVIGWQGTRKPITVLWYFHCSGLRLVAETCWYVKLTARKLNIVRMTSCFDTGATNRKYSPLNTTKFISQYCWLHVSAFREKPLWRNWKYLKNKYHYNGLYSVTSLRVFLMAW